MGCLHSASISSVGTLYVRDVAAPTLDRLRARARSNGRSLNAEVLEILDEVTSREDAELITQRLEELAARVRLPSAFIDDVIRSERESY
jgi:plasmid stability protein